jgi:hypothetical protein
MGVDAVEREVEELIDGPRVGTRPVLSGVEIRQRVTPLPTRLRRRPVTTLVAAQRELRRASQARPPLLNRLVLTRFSRAYRGSSLSALTWDFSSALGGIRTPNLLIRRSPLPYFGFKPLLTESVQHVP